MNSLATDSIFVAAITGNTDIMDTIGGRLYSTAIPLPDEDVDNVPVPYVIVTFDGLTNDPTTKDDPYESNDDQVNISIEVTATNREKLAALMAAIRNTVHEYMMTTADNQVMSYQFSADSVQYDSMKPCYWQTLHYQCEVSNEDVELEENQAN